MTKDGILAALQKEVEEYNKIIATENGDWIVKGFIDIYNDLILELPPQQNFYPDLTFVSKQSGEKFAVDIKSTFKDTGNKIKSMTLGAFTGYFRNRESTKNTLYSYGSYSAHLVLGVVYSQIEVNPNEKTIYSLDELDKIVSVIRDFKFFVQPKYKIASATPGSGNTKNIGSINNMTKLINGQGVFSTLGEEVYEDYWMFYLTKDMAKALEIQRPYTNLKSYLEYKQRGINILEEHKEEIEQLNEEEDIENENGGENDE